MTKEHFDEIIDGGCIWVDFKTDEEVIDFLNGLNYYDFECEWVENDGYENTYTDLISVSIDINENNSYDISVFIEGVNEGWDGDWKYFKTITYLELESLINK